MILSEIESMLNLFDRFRKYINFFKKTVEVESVAVRFIRLFEAHGVHRNQIPRFFGHGLVLKDIQDEVSLTAKLSEDVLDAVCAVFAVRREWLDGASNIAHPNHDFYKNPQEFLIFINELQTFNPKGQLRGELFASKQSSFNAEAILILIEIVGSVSNTPIYRYHLCNNWVFSYWKARCYLTACIAIAWKNKVYISGTLTSQESINKLINGEVLLGCNKYGVDSLLGQKWYPEDMALNPEVFLQNLDPEINNFGYISGLDLWLDLEGKGFMDTGIVKNTKVLFAREHSKYIKE